jgi:hypothetical protein
MKPRDLVIGLIAFAVGGMVVPAAAQQVVRIYGTLEGSQNNPVPIALMADSDGKLLVECVP